MISLSLSNIKKFFNNRKVIDNISLDLSSPFCLGITGKNGAGKSTLIKIIAGVLEPSYGKVEYKLGNKKTTLSQLLPKIGFAAPYLNLYDEFTALENIIIYDEIRGLRKKEADYSEILKKIDLFERRRDLLKTFSSGMKQRLKIAVAISNNPSLLLLDEPSQNLDESGIQMVHDVVNEYKKKSIVIVCSNDKNDYCLFDETIKLG